MSIDINCGMFIQRNTSSKNEEITSIHDKTIEGHRHNIEPKRGKIHL